MPATDTEKSSEWLEGFAAARHQAACEMGHFIIDEGGGESLAEAAYDHLKAMVRNPECREDA